MNWTVRVRSFGKVLPDVATVETFLDGFFHGLRAAGHHVTIGSDTDRSVDVELSFSTERRAVNAAQIVAEALLWEFPRTKFQVTLTVDVCRLAGGPT